MAESSYHHGDLRRALLVAAEAELAASGIEGFSLRKVARRAGVSHAAPAHHFKDSRGLLTALAAEGYRRFVETQMQRQAEADPDPESQMVAAGLGYIDFARDNNALFRLIFASRRPNEDDPDYSRAGKAAYDHLVNGMEALTRRVAYSDSQALMDVSAAWAMAHGLADLLSSGRLKTIGAMPEAQRKPVLEDLIRRAMPHRNA